MNKITLTWVDPKTSQRWQELFDLPVTIGRDVSNTVMLDDTRVSRRHASITPERGQVLISDLQSRNGVRLNGRPVTHAVISDGATIEIGSIIFTVMFEQPEPTRQATEEGATLTSPHETAVDAGDSDATVLVNGAHDDATIVATLNDDATVISTGSALRLLARRSPDLTMPLAPPAAPSVDWPPAIFAQQQVSVAAIQQIGLPVAIAEYATVGAGLGSFVWSDLLRVSGVKPEAIVALGLHPNPYNHYQLLTRNSQIPLHERIRSNSESTPDNVWGWPGYALREIWRDFWRGHISRAARTFWQIFNEPTFIDTYTPLIADVFRSLDREAKRIGWEQIFRYGRVRAVRKTDDGRYVIAYSTRGTGVPAGTPEHGFVLAHYVHMATGYPAIQFLKDLQQYREETGDFKTVVNAYENHEHIYEHLRKHGGLVMVRGRGIVASRILQRIYEERAHNPNIGVIHLLRSPLAEGRRYGRSRRVVIDHFEFQPFNWPRGCWTGPQRKQLERASTEERKKLLEQWGGTTTAKRQDWVHLVDRGRREGWYQVAFGEVEHVERGPAGKLVTSVKAKGQVSGQLHYATDFIIDATGLDAKVKVNPLLKDMVDHYALSLNPLERLHVENDFEVLGMRNGSGRIYAAGAMTLGGPNAGVDTFLGLQYAAYRSVDALRDQDAPGIHTLNGLRSVWQWLKWAQGVKP